MVLDFCFTLIINEKISKCKLKILNVRCKAYSSKKLNSIADKGAVYLARDLTQLFLLFFIHPYFVIVLMFLPTTNAFILLTPELITTF